MCMLHENSFTPRIHKCSTPFTKQKRKKLLYHYNYVYIPYTYKNDSIYGSVMNIFGCVALSEDFDKSL